MGDKKYLPSTPKEFLTIYAPNKVKRDLANVKTIRQALSVQTPSIYELKRTYGAEKVEAYIKIWLIQLNELLNTSRALNEAQIDETAFMIVSEFGNVSIADVNIIFKKAKMGEYGDLYGTLSIDKILRWFGDYFNDRCNTAGEMSREEADKIKYQEKRLFGDKRMSKDEAFEKFKRDYQIKEMQKKYSNGNNKQNKK